LNINWNHGLCDVSNFDSILLSHEEWWLGHISNKIEANIVGSNVLSTLGGDLWEDFKDLIWDALSVQLDWEEFLVCILHEGVNGVLVNP